RHMHADVLLTRTARSSLPAVGPVAGATRNDLSAVVTEEPLALIEHIVLDDRPYTEVVTADYTVVSELAPTMFADLSREPGPGEQVAVYTDGRPAAGILSTNGLWLRFQSAGQNYQRQRANAIASALLCASYDDRDIPISGDIDLSDDEALANALNTQAECVACHQTLDPLGSHLFTIRSVLNVNTVQQAYANGCAGQTAASCYPLPVYVPQGADRWRRFGTRPPGYFGSESDDLGTLGAHIAADPRFAQCTVRRFVSYLTQTPADELTIPELAPLQARFVDSGFDARDLVEAIVLDPAFARPDDGDGVGLMATRPFQLAATVEDLTGFRFVFNFDGAPCRQNGTNCRGDIDVVYDDTLGFRSMAGGIDGFRVTRPTWTTTPTKALFVAALAEEAAGHVVDADFALPAADRHLLGEVEADRDDEAAVRAQLVTIHLRFFGIEVDADDPEIDEAYQLFDAARARRSGPSASAEAWKVTLTGLLQDPRILLY
ncbi:MAG: hypothetical protein AAF211_31685, partial [Myxococcota bacterium]